MAMWCFEVQAAFCDATDTCSADADVLTLPVYDPPEVYLDVNIAGSLSYVMDGSVQFRIFVVSDESKTCDSLNVQLPQEKVKDAEGPAHHIFRAGQSVTQAANNATA